MASYQSTFTATENPLSESGAWTAGPASWDNIQSTGGTARPTTTGGFNNAAFVSTPTFGTNQYSQFDIVVATAATDQQGVSTRFEATGPDGYLFATNYNVADSFELSRIDNGAGTVLGAAYAITRSTPDTIRLESNVDVHTPYFNGSAQATRSDATYSAGGPGIFLYSDIATANSQGDAFDGGDLAAAGVPAMVYPFAMTQRQG